MRSASRSSLLALMSLLAVGGVAGCGSDSSSDPVAQAPGEGPRKPDVPPLAATKKKIDEGLKALVAKTSDPKLKKALEEAQAVLAKAPTVGIAQAFYSAYSLPTLTSSDVDSLNKAGVIFDIPRDANAPRIGLDPKAFAPTGELALALLQDAKVPVIALNLEDYRAIVGHVQKAIETLVSGQRVEVKGGTGWNIGSAAGILWHAWCLTGQGECGGAAKGIEASKENYLLAGALLQFYRHTLEELISTLKINSKGLRGASHPCKPHKMPPSAAGTRTNDRMKTRSGQLCT